MRTIKTIRQLREERGESQMQLAVAIGVTSKEIADWEMGKAEPTISQLRALTEHFGVQDDQIDLRQGPHPSQDSRGAPFGRRCPAIRAAALYRLAAVAGRCVAIGNARHP